MNRDRIGQCLKVTSQQDSRNDITSPHKYTFQRLRYRPYTASHTSHPNSQRQQARFSLSYDQTQDSKVLQNCLVPTSRERKHKVGSQGIVGNSRIRSKVDLRHGSSDLWEPRVDRRGKHKSCTDLRGFDAEKLRIELTKPLKPDVFSSSACSTNLGRLTLTRLSTRLTELSGKHREELRPNSEIDIDSQVFPTISLDERSKMSESRLFVDKCETR